MWVEDLRFDDADERELVAGLRVEGDLNVDEARLESLDRPAKELRQTNAVVEAARGEDGEIGNAVVDGTFRIGSGCTGKGQRVLKSCSNSRRTDSRKPRRSSVRVGRSSCRRRGSRSTRRSNSGVRTSIFCVAHADAIYSTAPGLQVVFDGLGQYATPVPSARFCGL